MAIKGAEFSHLLHISWHQVSAFCETSCSTKNQPCTSRGLLWLVIEIPVWSRAFAIQANDSIPSKLTAKAHDNRGSENVFGALAVPFREGIPMYPHCFFSPCSFYLGSFFDLSGASWCLKMLTNVRCRKNATVCLMYVFICIMKRCKKESVGWNSKPFGYKSISFL